MSNLITDGDFTTPQVLSGYRYIAPFSQYGINNLFVVEQDFVVNEANFSPLAIGTPHPTLAGFFLAIETPYQHVAINDTVKWTRRYAQVPASFSRPGGTYSYAFPVLLTGDLTTSRLFPKTITVNCRVQVDFFPTAVPDSIPIIQSQRYVLALHTAIDATSPYGQPVVADLALGLAETVPSNTIYQAWVAGGIEIVPEASRITSNWMGNIHMRETTYIKAV